MTIISAGQLISNAWFECKRAVGIFDRQSPTQPWSLIPPLPGEQADFIAKWQSKAPRLPIALLERQYLAPHLEQFSVTLGCSPEAEAKAIAVGQFRLANNQFINLGFPVDWNRNQQESAGMHWSKVSADVDSTASAINEASQFNWAYPLVRAWIVSGDDAHAEAFWSLLEDWMEKNPPNLGPQWVSDEAIARRILAVTFAAQAFCFHSSASDERLAGAARLILVSAKRLELTHDYSYTHSACKGLTVSLALFTAGALWPQLPQADVWRSEGLECLINRGRKIISSAGQLTDGTMSNPLLVLEIYTWAEIILRRENERESLPGSLHLRMRAIINKLIHRPIKHAPLTPLFSLSGCLYSDVRPTLGAAQILFTGTRMDAGPRDEAAILTVGPQCASAVTC